MRYSASEKFEIIELVEQSSLSIRRTLAPIGIPRSTFYDWYSRYQEGGIEALVDGKPRPRRIWGVRRPRTRSRSSRLRRASSRRPWLLLSGATMSQESSLTRSAHSVRQVLTAYRTSFGGSVGVGGARAAGGAADHRI